MNCLNCPKVDTCTELCDAMRKECEKDEVIWHEAKPESVYLSGETLRVFNATTGTDKPLLSEKQWQILNAKNIGFTASEIGKKLKITASSVRSILSIARKKASTPFINI